MKIRKAEITDLVEIVRMIADDKLGSQREQFQDELPKSYYTAFKLIDEDPNQNLMVFESDKGDLIGTMQLSFIPYLTYQGGVRAQIEAVRIRADHRGKGLGEKMILWAIDKARSKGAHLVQLTTDKQRPKAIAFYESLGFNSTHEGMKLHFK